MSLKWANVIEANAEIGRLETVLAQSAAATAALKAEKDALSEIVTGLQTELATAKTATATADQAASKAKADLIEAKAAVEKMASAKALEIVAAQGATPVKVPAAPGETAATAQDLLAQFNAIKDPEAKTAFYQKHRSTLKPW